jgi:hypothetical protein
MQYPEVRRLADAHHGVMALEELRRHVSRSTMSSWLARGWLVRIAPRAFAFQPRPTWRQVLHGIHLSSPQLIVSHRSAAALLGIVGSNRVCEFICATDAAPRLDSARVHESNFIPPRHWQVIHGTPVTSAARTLFDLSSVHDEERLIDLITVAIDLRLVTIAEVRRMLETMRRRGRRRTTVLEAVAYDAKFDDPKNRSDLEREARRLILDAGLPEPSAQHGVVFEHFTLHPDLSYPQWKFAIELDGYVPHGTRNAFDDDRERDAYLTMEGWHVVRFSSNTLHLLVPTIAAYASRRLAA